jgi:hypothetical protein
METGRPRHQPTEHQRSQVLQLTGLGLSQDEIATLLRLAPKTLRRHYRHELDTGAAAATAAVAQSLFDMATKYRVPSAAIFWLKCRAGWKEARPDDTNVGNGEPIRYELVWGPARQDTAGDSQYRQVPSTPVIDARPDATEEVEVVWAGGTRAG